MIATAVRRPVTVAMAFFTIALLGVAAFRNIPIELLPDTELPQLSVSATWTGASPELTEAFLTAPLEAVIQQVQGVDEITSRSQEGQASIQVEFQRDTDMDFARLELSERLASLEEQLPIGVTPTVTQYVPEEFEDQQLPVLLYTVHGPHTLEWLRERVEDVLVPELLQMPSVGHVAVRGGRNRVLQLELDEDRIRSLGLQLQTVSAAVQGMELVREAGRVDVPSGIQRTLTIRQRPADAAEVAALPLLMDQGRLVRLRDVGRVYETYEDPRSYDRINSQPSVSIEVFKAPAVNTVSMADSVRQRVAALAPTLGPGIRVHMNRDLSEDIREQLSSLRSRALAAAVIVLLVLLLFLRSFSAAAIVFATVGFAVLITINVMYFAGYTLNVLTLMGLAMGFGLVVDNAIVVLENVYRKRRAGQEPAVAAEHGAREVLLAIVAATGTTVIVLVPFVYLQGELRIYYMPLALVVGIALIGSMLVSFSFIPALAARLLARLPARPGNGANDLPLVARVYGAVISATLRWPRTTVVIPLLLLAGSYLLFDKYVTRGVNWGGLYRESTYISINISQPRGEELDRTDELARYFEDKLTALPEVERYTTRVGAQSASILVEFPDSLENTGVPVAIKDLMYQYSLGFGGADVRVYGYGPSFYGGGGSSPNYSIKILGYNYEETRRIAEGLAAQLTRFARIRDVDTNSSGYSYARDRATELVLDIDRARLAVYGLSAQDVVTRVAAAVSGRASGATLQVGGEELQLSLKLAGFRYLDTAELLETLIPAPTGSAVRLADVATLRERQVLNAVVRENQQYQRLVSYEFRGPTKLGDRIRDGVVKATALPPGYTIEERQSWEWRPEEKGQIRLITAVAVLLVFMLTAALFESLRQPLCVLLTVPMALIGVFLIFFYTGASFTREAYIGVIMMSGIVVNNSILLVDHVNQLRRRDGLALCAALERGARERVRPILMTSLTTVLGLLPLVLFSPTVDQNIWNALTYVLIGGLISSSVLVLTVTPALYLLFERRREARTVQAVAASVGAA